MLDMWKFERVRSADFSLTLAQNGRSAKHLYRQYFSPIRNQRPGSQVNSRFFSLHHSFGIDRLVCWRLNFVFAKKNSAESAGEICSLGTNRENKSEKPENHDLAKWRSPSPKKGRA